MSERSRQLTWLGLAVLASFGIRTISNAGIWLHLAIGRSIAGSGIPRTDPLSYTMAGKPWLDTTWLYDVLVYGVWQAAAAHGVILLHVAAVVLAFVLLIPSARRYANDTGTGMALLLSGWILAPVFVPAPAIFALVFPALFIGLLTRPGLGLTKAAAILAAQWVWTQIHGSFLLGPCICFLFAIPEDTAGARRKTPYLLLGAAAVMITLLNPYGWWLHVYVVASAGNVAATFVQEWISPFSNLFRGQLVEHAVTAGLVLGAVGIMTYRDRLPVALTVLAVLGAVLVVLRPHMYHELFALLAFPFLALSFRAGLDFFRGALPDRQRGALAKAVVLVLGVLSLGWVFTDQFHSTSGSASAFGLGVEYAMFPEEACQVISRPDFPDPTVNVAADGGYLAWRLPGRKVFMDDRADLYRGEFYQDFADAFTGDELNLGAFETKWNPNAIIINCCLPGATVSARNLLTSGRWALTYFDGTTAILIRAAEEFAGLLENSAVQEAGLQVLENERKAYQSALGPWFKPPCSPRLIGAANLFIDLEKYREALAVYVLLARGTRGMASAWVGLGFCQLKEGHTEDAVRSLEHATRRFDNDIKAWLWLSEAYAKAGQPADAQRAFERAQKLQPHIAARFGSPLERARENGVTNSIRLPPGMRENL